MEFVDGQVAGRRCSAAASSASSVARIGAQLAQRARPWRTPPASCTATSSPRTSWCASDGYVKLLDFGVARLLAGATSDRTQRRRRRRRPSSSARRATCRRSRRAARAASSAERRLLARRRPLRAGHRHASRSNRRSTLGTLHAIATRDDADVRRSGVVKLPPALRAAAAAHAGEASRRAAVGRRGRSGARRGWPPALDERRPHRSVAAAVAASRRRRCRRSARRWSAAPMSSTAVKGMLLDPDIAAADIDRAGRHGQDAACRTGCRRLRRRSSKAASAFVNLAPIVDPSLVASAVAQAIGVRESGDHAAGRRRSPNTCATPGRRCCCWTTSSRFPRPRALVRELLDACPALKVLVTSRVVLHIYGEQEFPVPPLPLPERELVFACGTTRVAIIALFVQRAAAGRPDFALTAKNAEPLPPSAAGSTACRWRSSLPPRASRSCRRRTCSPGSSARLELLTGGARDLPERQQTLRGAIKWSYDLLTPAEQRLFRRLSVFAGGCTLEAAEAVCDTSEDLGVDVLLEGQRRSWTTACSSSVLQTTATRASIMLETFREYGRERLRDSGETEPTQRAHAAYMLVLAEEENTRDESGAARRVAPRLRCRARQLPRRDGHSDRGRRCRVGAAARRRAVPLLGAARPPDGRARNARSRPGDA